MSPRGVETETGLSEDVLKEGGAETQAEKQKSQVEAFKDGQLEEAMTHFETALNLQTSDAVAQYKQLQQAKAKVLNCYHLSGSSGLVEATQPFFREVLEKLRSWENSQLSPHVHEVLLDLISELNDRQIKAAENAEKEEQEWKRHQKSR